jgi:hypothetical protein
MAQSNEDARLPFCHIMKLLIRHGGYFHGPRANHIGITEIGFWNFVRELLAHQSADQ